MHEFHNSRCLTGMPTQKSFLYRRYKQRIKNGYKAFINVNYNMDINRINNNQSFDRHIFRKQNKCDKKKEKNASISQMKISANVKIISI